VREPEAEEIRCPAVLFKVYQKEFSKPPAGQAPDTNPFSGV